MTNSGVRSNSLTLETDDASGSCLNEEQVNALTAGELDEAAVALAHSHIASCETCRAWVAMLVKLDRTSDPRSDAAESTTESSDPLRGVTLGRYQLRTRIGKGAAGLVYRAFDPSLEREVAVKLLRDVDNDQWRKRMFREARAMAKLSHPNIVPVFDVGEVETDLFIAMELIEDGSMREWLKISPEWRSVVGRFVDVGRGLSHIHDSGFLHRDIKPENILVDQTLGRAFVADLGLSGTAATAEEPGAQGHALGTPELTDSNALLRDTQTGVAIGTPAYLAPELRDGTRATSFSDQFSFSRSLWEALGGSPDKRNSLRARGVPDRVARVIATGLADSPEDRHSSMAEMVEALEASLVSKRRRYLTFAALALAVGATVVLTAILTRPKAIGNCANLEQRASEVWSGDRKAELTTNFSALAPSGRAVATALDKQMSLRLQSWLTARQRVCKENETKQNQASLLRAACLEDQLDALDTFVVVAQSTDKRGVERANRTLSRLPSANACKGDRPLVGPLAPSKNVEQYYRLKREISAVGTKLRLGYQQAKDDMLAIQGTVEAVDSDALRADHAYLLGVIEHKLGNLAAAKQHFDQASILGETSGHDRIRALALAAVGGSRELSYEEALGYMQRAQAVIKRVNGSGDFRADIELLLGDLHRRHGKWEETRAALGRAKEAIEADSPVDEGRLAEVYRQLSASSRDPVANEKNAREALRLDRNVYGDETVQTVDSLVALAETLRWTGKLDESDSTLVSAIALHRRVYGDDHVNSALLHTNLCVTITDLVIGAAPANPDKEGLARAEGHCKEAIRISKLHVIEEKPATMRGVSNARSALGRLYNASRRFEEGLVQFERAFEVGTKAKNRPSDMTTIHVGLASCLAELGRDLPRALYLLEETQEVYQEIMGPQMAAGLDAFVERLREVVPAKDRLKGPPNAPGAETKEK